MRHSKTIQYVLMDWNPEDEPEFCPSCESEDLVTETCGPFTDGLQCEDCEAWIPQ